MIYRKQKYYPVDDATGKPTSEIEATRTIYQVWDYTYETHGTFSSIYTAIDRAIELNRKEWEEEELP